MPADATVHFEETQPAWRNRFLLTIIACEAIILTAILGGFALKFTGPARVEIIIAWVVCVVVMPGLILSFRLRTRLTGRQLRAWFPPLPGWKIDFADIAVAESKKLSPLGDLGGWGYKLTKKHGHVVNVHGEQFVILTLEDGKRRTIGTQRPEELLTAIRVLAQLPPESGELSEIESKKATA